MAKQWETKASGYISPPPDERDYVFGGSSSLATKTTFGSVALVPDGDWRPYLYSAIYSLQAPGFETNACVSFGTCNAIELLKNRLHSLKPDLSDRFVAKGAGTDPMRGIDPRAVAEFIRRNWAVYEHEWPTSGLSGADEFYLPIPAPLMEIAKQRGKEFAFGYEKVSGNPVELREALKYGPVGMAVGFNGVDENGLWYRGGADDTHWVVLLHIDDKGVHTILDSYEPYIKRVHPDFRSSYCLRYGLDEQKYTLLTQAVRILRLIAFRLTNRLGKFGGYSAYARISSVLRHILDAITGRKPPFFANKELLCLYAQMHLGWSLHSASPPELACAEAVTTIIDKVKKIPWTNRLSTYYLRHDFLSLPYFLEVEKPEAGDIVLSPTGYGGKNGIDHGHIGIVLDDGKIASNDSETGKFVENYTIETWRSYYVDKGGYEMRFFRIV